MFLFVFFSSRRRHTRFDCDWSSDVCSSDLSESVRGEQICRIRWERSGGNGHQIGNRGMWNRHEIQTGCAGEIGTQTGIFPWTEIEETADSRLAEIGRAHV